MIRQHKKIPAMEREKNVQVNLRVSSGKIEDRADFENMEKIIESKKAKFIKSEIKTAKPDVELKLPEVEKSDSDEFEPKRQKKSRVSFHDDNFMAERYTNARKSIYPVVDENEEDDVFESKLTLPPIDSASISDSYGCNIEFDITFLL